MSSYNPETRLKENEMEVINSITDIMKKIPYPETKKTKENRSTSLEKVDYDTVLSAAGQFGRYQLFLFFASFPFYVYGVLSYFTQLFITEVSSDHWCWIPALENLTEIERKNLAIPADPGSRLGYSRCHMYEANWTEVLSSGQKPDETWNVTSCRFGWEFNKSEIPYPTISSELGWVCERDSYQATAQSIFSVGCICGGFIIGWVADKYGRIPAAVLGCSFGCVGGIVSIFARNLLEFALCRVLVGMSYDNCMMMMYLLVLEYVAPKYRSIMSNLPFALFYSLTLVVLPWIAKACNHWKLLSIVTAVPFSLAVFAPFIVPESPRWLLSKNRVDEAIQNLVKIGQLNKKEIPTELIENFKQSLKTKDKNYGENMIELLKRPLLCGRYICICLLNTCVLIVFDSLVRSIGNLQIDFFLSFILISLTEFPALLIVSFALDYTGRKFMCLVTMSVSCLFCIFIGFVDEGVPSLVCAIIARFCINMALNSIYLWTTEVLSTEVRGSGAAIAHIFGYIGIIIAPFLVYLDVYVSWLPYVIFGCISGLGAILTTFIPETAMKKLPRTFEEAEDLIRNQKLWEMPFLEKKKLKISGDVNESFEMLINC